MANLSDKIANEEATVKVDVAKAAQSVQGFATKEMTWIENNKKALLVGAGLVIALVAFFFFRSIK